MGIGHECYSEGVRVTNITAGIGQESGRQTLQQMGDRGTSVGALSDRGTGVYLRSLLCKCLSEYSQVSTMLTSVQ